MKKVLARSLNFSARDIGRDGHRILLRGLDREKQNCFVNEVFLVGMSGKSAQMVQK